MPAHNIAPKHYSARHASDSRNSRPHRQTRLSKPSQRWIIWLVTIGIFLPFTFGETGKYVIVLLFLPAIFVFVASLSRGERRMMPCDFFVWAAALWMIAVKSGSSELSSGALFISASDALAFLGSYVLARTFFYGYHAVKEFLTALKFTAIVLIALSVLDTLSGTFFTKELIRTIFPDPRPYREQAAAIHRSFFGVVVLRAASTFGHPILYGTFCSITAIILLFSERGVFRRFFYFTVCFVGCALSISSAALLSLAIGVSIYAYDRLLYAYSSRWKLLWLILAAVTCVVFVVSNSPITWVFRHLTLDPQTGYYRILIWQHAADYIALSPITGGNVSSWATDEILSDSVDSVWVVLSLLYGLPMVALLVLASLSACGIFWRKINRRLVSREFLRIRTAFSLVLFLFALLGLTVHFWGAIWMFWGLCIGVRTTIEEYCLTGPLPPDSSTGLRPKYAEVSAAY